MSKEGDTPAAAPAPSTGQDVFSAIAGDDAVPDSGRAEPASGGSVDSASSSGSEPASAPAATPSAAAQPSTPQPTSPTAPVPPATAATGNASPVPPAQPSSTAPASEPTPAPVEQTPSPELTEQSQQLTPETLKQFEEQAMVELGKMYTLTPEQLAKVETDGLHTVLPQMLARAHINMMNSAMRLIQQQTPTMFKSFYSTEQAKKVFATKLYGAFPALKDAKAAPVVRDLLKRARALDPSMSMDDLIQVVGSQASVKLKLPVGGGTGAVPPTPPASPAPTFAPAAPAARPTPPPVAAKPMTGVNWSELVEEEA